MTNPDPFPQRAADLRQKAELLARQRADLKSRDSEELAPEEIEKTLHELRVHEIELEMQNEELRMAQVEIEAGRERYFELYNLAPVGYCILSETGIIQQINLTAATLLGMNRRELIKQPISRFILKDDQDIYYFHRKKLFETNETQECEMRLIKQDGTIFWAHFMATVDRDQGGTPVCRCVVREISKRKQAEIELRKVRELSERIIKDGPVAITLVNRDGKIVFANRHAEQLFDLKINTIETLGYNDPAWQISDVDGSPFPEERLPFSLVMSTGQAVYNIQHAITRRDATRKILSINGAPLHDEQGRIDRVVFVCQDITERSQHEEHLRKFKRIVSSTSDGIALLDANYRYMIVNEAYERFSSRSQKDLIGLTVSEYLGDAIFNDQIKPRFDQCLTGETVTFRGWFEYPSFGMRFVEVTYSPYIDAMGTISGVVANTRDITERNKVEEALERSQRELQVIYDSVPMMLCVVDEARRVCYANHALAIFTGLDKETLLGEVVCGILGCVSATESRSGCGCDEQCADCALLQALNDTLHTGASHSSIECQLTLERAGRRENVTLQSATAAIPGTHGKSALLCLSDITEQRALAEQLSQAKKLESVGRLAGGVAHDFNNMLAIILGHADIILEQMNPDQPFYDDLTEIRVAGERSANLTRQLLAFARKETVAPRVIDLNKTVEGMLKMLQSMIGENIEMVWIPGENLWPVEIDPTQFNQILANLCLNARDAIADVGKVTVETGNTVVDEAYCRMHADFVPGDYTLLTVRDNGSGMDFEMLSHLFEPFFTTKELGKGTGLGLATVYGVVKQNNGFINVYSKPDQGSTFTIYLPRYRLKETQPLEMDATESVARGHETILLVEDEPAILRMTTMMLERSGYNVLGACTPRKAIALAHEYPDEIHLLITDVVMPEMNGRDLAKNILKIHPNIKLLFMSGYTANVIAHHGVLDEGVHFIQKPFPKQTLLIKTREVLDVNNL